MRPEQSTLTHRVFPLSKRRATYLKWPMICLALSALCEVFRLRREFLGSFLSCSKLSHSGLATTHQLRCIVMLCSLFIKIAGEFCLRWQQQKFSLSTHNLLTMHFVFSKPYI